jgi:hypothetical protein
MRLVQAIGSGTTFEAICSDQMAGRYSDQNLFGGFRLFPREAPPVWRPELVQAVLAPEEP